MSRLTFGRYGNRKQICVVVFCSGKLLNLNPDRQCIFSVVERVSAGFVAMPADNIWDAAIALQREAKHDSSSESTLIFLGSKRSGKSSVMYRFVERSELPRPSLALEYMFARKTRGASSMKEVCHMWELAGGSLSSHLLEIPITKRSLSSLAVVMVTDLSIPEELWVTMEALLKAAQSQIETVITQAEKSEPGYREVLESKVADRIPSDHPDRSHLKPFPVPLLIVGTKYDIFQDVDPEKKKVVCRFLRNVAHVNCASLQFVNLKSESSVSKLKATLSHLGFRSSLSKSMQADYNKQLNITAGEDTFHSIGGTLNDETDNATNVFKMQELWKYQFLEYFPQVELKTILPDDPCKDPNFREKDIDTLRTQKDKELEQFRTERERAERAKMHLDWDKDL
ncbi:cytoplasmic dynein 2 light intermediate chain 1-like [Ornithodoros turicata]|uniref:cytoplasmic dynein 2 light intermediate chain 1-like n=1 Tax=Ornithodoros turicata TaxID=34597 RepID=UPI0031398BA1